MKVGDTVYRVQIGYGPNKRPVLCSATVKTIRKDGTIALTGDRSGWRFATIVPADQCATSPADAAMDYLQRCNAALESARESVANSEIAVKAARDFAVEIERGTP